LLSLRTLDPVVLSFSWQWGRLYETEGAKSMNTHRRLLRKSRITPTAIAKNATTRKVKLGRPENIEPSETRAMLVT
jgi:hypothetical protein